MTATTTARTISPTVALAFEEALVAVVVEAAWKIGPFTTPAGSFLDDDPELDKEPLPEAYTLALNAPTTMAEVLAAVAEAAGVPLPPAIVEALPFKA